MRSDCIDAVSRAIGRALTSVEVQNIEARITGAMRRRARAEPTAWMAKSASDRLQEAGQAAAAELIGEAHLKKERVALQVAAHLPDLRPGDLLHRVFRERADQHIDRRCRLLLTRQRPPELILAAT